MKKLKGQLLYLLHSVVIPFLLVYCFWFGFFELYFKGYYPVIPIFILGIYGMVGTFWIMVVKNKLK